MPLLDLKMRTPEPGGSWEVARAIVLEFLRLHGADVERALLAMEAWRRTLPADPVHVEVGGEVRGDPESCAFEIRVQESEGSAPFPLGTGRSRPLP